MNKYNVDIVISDGNGKIIHSQPFEEFTYGTKNIEIQKVMYGSKLFDLLWVLSGGNEPRGKTHTF